MSVHAGLLTVEEFLKLRDPKEGRLELHHGEVVAVPHPKWGHQRIQDRVQTLMKPLAAGKFAVHMEMAFRPSREYEVCGQPMSVASPCNGKMPLPITSIWMALPS